MKRRTLLKITGASVIAAMGKLGAAMAASNSQLKGIGMIIVTFEVEFEDDQIHGELDAIKTMDEATARETGCITYKTSFDANNSRIMRIYEMWESMDALIPHFQTPHMAEFQKALGGLKSKSMEAKVYEISKELPFPN